jgi:hypothetical protein
MESSRCLVPIEILGKVGGIMNVMCPRCGCILGFEITNSGLEHKLLCDLTTHEHTVLVEGEDF